MAIGGSFNTTGYEGRYLTFSWQVKSQSVADNTTTITWYLRGAGDTTSYYYLTQNIKVTIDGVTVFKHVMDVDGQIQLSNGTVVATGTYTFRHDGEGKRSFAAYAEAGIYNWSVNCTGSSSFDLPQIARASAITSVANVTLGNKCGVTWTPASVSFRYKLKFSLGNWNHTTGAIHPNKTSAYTYAGYTIPLDVAYQILNGFTGVMTVTLYTYSNSDATTQIGSADSETFQVTVPDSEAPRVSMSLSPVHSLPATFNNVYVQGVSKVKAVITAETKYNASLVFCDMTLEGKTYGADDNYTSGYLTTPEEIEVVGQAMDSRDYGGYVTQYINVIPYANPKIQNVTAERCNADGVLDSAGTYLRITAKRSYHRVMVDGVQKNFCQIRYRYKVETDSYYSDWVTIMAADDLSSDEVTTSPLLEGNLLTTATYRVEVQAVDYISNSTPTAITVSTDKVYWHRDGARNALGLGKYNERDDALDSAWDIYMNDHRVTGLPTPADSTDAVPLGFLIDYIVEQGTSGIWTYRKWNSGIAEAWGNTSVTVVTQTAYGGGFYNGSVFEQGLPTGLFLTTPHASMSVYQTSDAQLYFPAISVTRANQLYYSILSTKSNASATIGVGFRLTGRWRE